MYVYNSPEFFKNLNVKYWILVHFHAEDGGILYWVPQDKVNELPIYAWKSGGSKSIVWPRIRKSGGSIDPLDPVLPRSMRQ